MSVYDVTKEMPTVIQPPSPATLKGMKWMLVHFPSRRWVLLKKSESYKDALRGIKEGKNYQNLLVEKKSQKRATKVAHAHASHGPVEGRAEKEESKKGNSLNDEGFTEVPEGMTFDSAMDMVFPVARITREYERLLRAEEDIFDREGNRTGSKPAFHTQFAALKALTEWRVGRPGEKEKPPAEKKRLSHEELIAWLESNEDAVEYMKDLVKRAEVKLKMKKTPTAAPVRVSS